MGNYILSNYERETTITYNDDSKDATLYTCNKAMMRKLDGMCEKYPDKCKMTRQDEYSKTYVLPKKFIKINAPRFVSDEQREKMRQRALSRIKI